MLPRINLYGGPGVGKSTLAARVFAALKADGALIELVTEFAKLRVYENRLIRGWDYVHTFSQQHRAEHRFLSGGSSIVTDSPMLLQCYYARRHDCPVTQQLFEISSQWESDYPACNILVPPQGEYQPKGRWQDAVEAGRIHGGIQALLDANRDTYHVHSDLDSTLDYIRNRT